MVKKMTLTATLAFAVAALVAPAAQAVFTNSNWTMGASMLSEPGEMEGAGQLKFNSTSGLGGIKCDVVVHIKLIKESSTGQVDEFTPTNCMNFGYLLTACGTTSTPTPTSIPWTVHGQTSEGTGRILVTAPRIDNSTGGAGFPSCPNGGQIDITGSSETTPLFVLPDSATTATELILNGEVATTLGLSKAEGTIVLTSGSGTYGI